MNFAATLPKKKADDEKEFRFPASISVDPPSGEAVRRGIFFDVKTDFLFWFIRGFHKLADGFEQCVNAFVMLLDPALQFGELPREFFVQRQRFAQPHEGAHDGDIDMNGALASQDAGKHGDALLGEGRRGLATSAMLAA